jgi:hypothetical protein
MRSSDTLTKISPALVKAINAIEGVKKGADNPFFKSKYANLESVIEAAHGALEANGLAVMQGPGPMDGNCITLTTRLVHESGEWIETDFSLPAGKMDPQAAGSAITYARRYSLMAMLNMPAVDDDGEASMPRSTKPGEPKNPNVSVHPEGPDWYKTEGAGMSAAKAKAEGLGEKVNQWLGDLETIPTLAALRGWADQNGDTIRTMPKGWRIEVREAFDRRGRELGAM